MTGPNEPDRDLAARLRDLERLLDSVVDGDDEALLQRLEEATSDLHSLIGDAIADAGAETARADLDAAVDHVLRSFVAEQRLPLVVRQLLCGRPLPVACSRDQLLHIVRRALALFTSRAAAGSTLDVATRDDGDEAVLLVSCDDPGASLPERAATLREFAESIRGSCAITADERGAATLSLSLPLALERN